MRRRSWETTPESSARLSSDSDKREYLTDGHSERQVSVCRFIMEMTREKRKFIPVVIALVVFAAALVFAGVYDLDISLAVM